MDHKHTDSKQINCLQILQDMPLRIFLEDLLSMYWDISDLPTEKIPSMFNILAAYSEEPEYALHVVQDNFPDLTKKDSDFYQKYQRARNSKSKTFSKALLPYLKTKVILDLGGEDTRLVDTLISMNPAIEKAYVTDINMIKNHPKNPKVEFLWQQYPDLTPLPKESVDTVIMSTMLHHIDPPVRIKLLIHVMEILKENGRIILIEDSFPETLSEGDIKTRLDERFLSFSNKDKLLILSFLDWWGNRLMKNSREIPLPCSFNSIEKWESLFAELGMSLIDKQYLGIPAMHTHIMAPKALIVFEKSADRGKKDLYTSNDCCVKNIVRVDSNKETSAFIPKQGFNINMSIGGSKIQTRIVDSNAEDIFTLAEFSWRKFIRDEPNWASFDALDKREWFISKVIDQIDFALEQLKADDGDYGELESIGIAWAGPVKPDGLVIGPNIDGFKFKDLSTEEIEKEGIDLSTLIKDRIAQKFGHNNVNVILLNDGDAAAIGNFKRAKIDNGLLLNVGTGIGSGIVKNGEVLYSLNGFKDRIGEIGHHIVYQPLYNRYFYYGICSRGKIIEQINNFTISERLAGPGLVKKFVARLKREYNDNSTKIHSYLNSCRGEDEIVFSEIELASCDENCDLGPLVEKKILRLITCKAIEGDKGTISFISEVGYELGLGIGTFIKEFEREKFVNNIILSGSLGESFGLGLYDALGEDLFLSQLMKGIKWSLRNHNPDQNAQFLLSIHPGFFQAKRSSEDSENSKIIELIK
jgi:predicted NBD/HSP70 family sugar kinase